MADSTSNNTPDLILFQSLYLILGAATCFLEGYHQAHTQLRVKLKTAEQNLRKVVQELKERDQLIEDLLDLQFPEPEGGAEDEEEDESDLESWNGDSDDPEAPTENSDNEIGYTPQNSEVDNIQGIETNLGSDSSVPTEEIGPLYGEDDEGYYSDGGGYYYYDSHDKDIYEECCCRFNGSFDQIRESGDKMSESNESSESVKEWLEVIEIEKPEAVMEDELWEGDNVESFAGEGEEEWEEIFGNEGEDADDEAAFIEDGEDEEEFASATEGFEEEEFDREDFEREKFEDEGFEEEDSEEEFEDAEQQDEERNTRNQDARELWRAQTRVMEKSTRSLEVFNQNTMAREERSARFEEEPN